MSINPYTVSLPQYGYALVVAADRSRSAVIKELLGHLPMPEAMGDHEFKQPVESADP